MIYYGDEVAMTGAKDPDCRRGMLWDESRQDKDMLSWYKRLLRVRKEIPAITRGKTVAEEAQDKDGLICVTRCLEDDEVTILFHAKEDAISLPALSGKRNLLTDNVFDGKVQGITALVLK